MKFSVLINNYNYARYLPDALRSVMGQSYPAHEILVVDDGSQDDSLAVLNAHRDAIPNLRIHAQPNQGQLSALRSAVRIASGDWCVFLDSDDSWEPEHLARLAAIITTEPDLGSIFTGHRETEGPPIHRINWPAGRVGPSIALVATFRIRIGAITSAISLRKDFAIAAMDIDPVLDADWRIRADDCLVYGAALHGAIAYHNPAITVNYRIHDQNAYAHRHDSVKRYRDRFRLARLCTFYAARIGILESDLAANLGRELSFPDNRHRYIRSRYRRAIGRLDVGLLAKLNLYWKSFR
jgi:glycosyltransferase involved in cell wall biosynthesis